MGSRESDRTPTNSPEAQALGDERPTVPREVIRAYLARPETRAWLHKYVSRKLPHQDVENVVNDICVEALSTTATLRDEKALPGWLQTIADRQIADLLEQRRRRKKHEGPMPAATRREDAYTGAPASEGDEPPPGADARHTELDVDAWMVRRWLQGQVKGNPRDQEALEMLLDQSQRGKTYEQIAKERGKSVAAIKSQIFEFRKEYTPRYKQFRERVVPVIVLGGVVAAAIVVYLVLLLLHPPRETRPAPAVTPRTPPAAVTVAPGSTGDNVAHPPPSGESPPSSEPRPR
jgi:DNA-directed RNA polymerase specialized sigma24 family protein